MYTMQNNPQFNITYKSPDYENGDADSAGL